jgi:glyoxylase-like metal-dependent hydrolase (beta-lactamase superfamily II)
VTEVRCVTVGAIEENCYFVRREGAATAVVVDPGAEPDRLQAELASLGVAKVAAILLTHTHFDHVGAVAALHAATGALVYCPVLEREVLANINDNIPAGFPVAVLDSYDADVTLSGGETLEFAGLRFDVRFTPGHSLGHLTYAVTETGAVSESGGVADAPGARGAGAGAGSQVALFSGDVLFHGSVGRADLPGGDWPTLLESIRKLVAEFPPQSAVYPGHGVATTLAEELDTNPYLSELSRR